MFCSCLILLWSKKPENHNPVKKIAEVIKKTTMYLCQLFFLLLFIKLRRFNLSLPCPTRLFRNYRVESGFKHPEGSYYAINN